MSEDEKVDSMNPVSDGFTAYTTILVRCRTKRACLKRKYNFAIIPKIGWTILHDENIDVEMDVERILMNLHSKQIEISLSSISIEDRVFDAEVEYWINLGYKPY